MVNKGPFPAVSTENAHLDTLYEHLFQFHKELNEQLKAYIQNNKKLPIDHYLYLLSLFEELKKKITIVYSLEEVLNCVKTI